MTSDAIVMLTEFEIELAGYVALKRVLFNVQRGVKEKHGAKSELGGFDMHFAGCLGELATAKHLNCYWSGVTVGDYHVADVGWFIQVRAKSLTRHQLLLHPDDKDHEPFVLAHVVGSCLPRVRLCGWMQASEGKKPEFWKDMGNGRPAFFIPENLLRPMTELQV